MNARNSIKLGVVLAAAIVSGTTFANTLNLGNGVGGIAVTHGLLGGGGGGLLGGGVGGGGHGLGGLLRVGHGGLLSSRAGGLVTKGGGGGLLGTGLLRNPDQHR